MYICEGASFVEGFNKHHPVETTDQYLRYRYECLNATRN